MTEAARRAKSRADIPVPAPMSAIVNACGSPNPSSAASIASGGYEGRNAAYACARESKRLMKLGMSESYFTISGQPAMPNGDDAPLSVENGEVAPGL